MKLVLNTNRIEDYHTFLKVKSLPVYKVKGHEVWFPDEYASELGISPVEAKTDVPIEIGEHCFDYQRDATIFGIRKQKFCHFWRAGLGKTQSCLYSVKHARKALPPQKRCLIIAPLMTIDQELEEYARFCPSFEVEQVHARNLKKWMCGEGGIGITNFESLTEDIDRGNLGCLAIQESSILKSGYGKWGAVILRIGKGLDWKFCFTGTPAPNDRIEFANHAVFMDQHPNVNAFLAKYFVNRGETQERWELKPHALEPFYRGLSHWSLFINNPRTYGWKGNSQELPPIRFHVEHYDATDEQMQAYRNLTGNLVVSTAGGICTRSKMAQIAKGNLGGQEIETGKFKYIRKLLDSWPDESTIIWCKFNAEQERMEREFPQAASISGDTPHEDRMRMIRDFKAGRVKILISKPKLMQFGLNLQIVTRHVWSTLQDSFEELWQGCCRSNRIGSTKPLDVHIPINELEQPMVDNTLRKLHRVEQDMVEQEAISIKCGLFDWLKDGIV